MKEMQRGKEQIEKRSYLIAGIFSLAFSAALVFGARLDSVENVDVKITVNATR